MHHAFDKQSVERNEHAEARHACDPSAEHLAHPLLDEPAFEPRLDIARGVVGPALARRQPYAQLFPARVFPHFRGQGRLRGLISLFRPIARTAAIGFYVDMTRDGW